MTGFVDRWFTSKDGLKLYARDYAGAEGPARLPVIAIHGLTRNSADFEDVSPVIAATGRRVLALDVRGRGRSAWDPNPMQYHPLTYAGDVEALFAQAGLDRAVFLGTSMGGIITMTLAQTAPKRIAAAMINDVGPQVSPIGLGRIAAYVGKGAPVTSWPDAAAYVKRNNEVAFPTYTDADWDAFARRCFREGEDGVPVLNYDPDINAPIRAAGPKALTPNLWPIFRKLAKGRPLMLIRGGASDLLDADIAKKMRKAAPDMTYVEVPEIGHAPMLTEPQAKSAILQFLSQVP